MSWDVYTSKTVGWEKDHLKEGKRELKHDRGGGHARALEDTAWLLLVFSGQEGKVIRGGCDFVLIECIGLLAFF